MLRNTELENSAPSVVGNPTETYYSDLSQILSQYSHTIGGYTMKKVLVILLMCSMIFVFATTAQSSMYSKTLNELMAAVTGETQASANYLAFADAADKEGHKEIAAIFRAFSDSELKHASDEFIIARKIDSSAKKPTPNKVTPGTTKENLQAAINGETLEYSVLYPKSITVALKENMFEAAKVFDMARQAEKSHANIFSDLLENIDNFDRVKYARIYRCTTCGAIILTTRPEFCLLCDEMGEVMTEYEIVK